MVNLCTFYVPSKLGVSQTRYYVSNLCGKFPGTAKDKFFAEIDGPLDDRYVDLLTDGSNGAYGYSGVEPSEETKKAACQALAEFIY